MKKKCTGLILILLACAQKMLPPSPDRFPPKLKEVEVLNRTKINLKFNEPIDAKTIIKDSILLTSVHNESLLIREIAIEKNGEIVILVTEPQSPIRYSIVTKVADLEGNWTKVQGKFYGSSQKDTMPPKIRQITPKPGATKQSSKIRIELKFSEAIDTLSPLNWLVLPKSLRSRFKTNWEGDFKGLSFTLSDSVGTDTIVYFALLRSIFDYDKNRLALAGFTFFTSDTLLLTKLVTGKVKYQDKPFSEALVIFTRGEDSTEAVAFTLSDSIGNFAIQVRTGIYDVTALADTNFDNLIDLSGKIQNFNAVDEKLEIEIFSDSLGKKLDWYLN